MVRREALGAAEHRTHARVVERREAVHGLREVRPDPVPVGRQARERDIGGDAVERPRPGDGLEQSDEDAAALLAVVAVAIRVLDDGQVRMRPLDGVRDQVVMLRGLERHRDTGRLPHLARPHPGGVDDDIGGDGALVRHDARDAATIRRDAGRGDALEDPCTAHPGALRVGHRQIRRVHPSFIRHVEGRQDIVGLRGGPVATELRSRDLVVLDAEPAHEGRLAPERLESLRRRRKVQVPDLAIAGRLPGLCLEGAAQVARVARHPQQGLGRHAGRRDQSGRVPGRARGQRPSLQQHDIRPTELRQVVGDARPGCAAADDHGLGVGWEGHDDDGSQWPAGRPDGSADRGAER